MNKVILCGNVGSDPRMRFIGTRPVAEFSLATNERIRRSSESGEVAEITEWHNLVMWDHNAEFAEKYIRKGTRLLVEGKIRTREWQDRNAIKHKTTEIYVDTFEIFPR